MKYADLVQFDPVESVKVLTDAADVDQAREDVRTFVISEDMAKKLVAVIFPNLQFEEPKDQKGLMIVANYGTGKTHLMSVISAVAERAELRELITNDTVKDQAGPIAGNFKVIRAEIGATRMTLRDIVTSQIEDGLRDLSIDFAFHSDTEKSGIKDDIKDMMAEFEKKFPDQGLLFVLDELLDYLRSRRDTELVFDLQFLREIGEICENTRFRFIAGVQEAIFGNPRFANVADAVGRVKDRFEQIRISRSDVAFVVEERLLHKSQQQRELVRSHLQEFTPLYEGMSENLDSYVSLFPVHPEYLETFEALTVIEKREILKTLSREIGAILDDDVPEDDTGLISFDSYRARLAENPAFQAIEDVKIVLDKSDVLRRKIKSSLSSKQYIPTALRIVDGLAVHRLTTDGVDVPIGLTAEELRDGLCLLPAGLPEREAMFLGVTITSILGEVMTAVNGQYISEDPQSGQFYLDVHKDTDFDQLIAERANSLDESKLDEGYFRALEELLELRDRPYVSGFRIWEYELAWDAKDVMRRGYLFMGAPNERSTAQPSRDFYLYFLQPYDPPKFNDTESPDEVFFRLDVSDDEFTSALRTYAGAVALSTETANQEHRRIYEDKARRALQSMVAWLKSHMRDAFSITHSGDEKPLGQWLGVAAGERSSVKDQIDTIASHALADHFESRYPGYPKFGLSVPVGRGNLSDSVKAALDQITGRTTALGTSILSGLELLDANGDIVHTGTYASALQAEVAGANGKVLNRKDLLTERDRDVWTWGTWHLEPIWVAVIAAALTQLGRMQIGYPGGQIDALGLARLHAMSTAEIDDFKHLAPPKSIPVVTLRRVAKLLGSPEGIVQDSGLSAEGVNALLVANAELLNRTVEARRQLQQGINLWGESVAGDAETRDARLGSLQSVLEDVKARDTIGKMNRLDLDQDKLDAATAGRDELEWVEAASKARNTLGDSVEYLREAAEVFGDDHPLSVEAADLRTEIFEAFRTQAPVDLGAVASLNTAATNLRRRFASEAVQAHNRDRLDGEGDERKRKIIEGDRLRDLDKLSSVSILPSGAFGSIRERHIGIGVCKTFNEDDLMKSTICPDCKYRPRPSTGPTARAAVEAIEKELDDLYTEWQQALLDSLAADGMADQIDLLKPAQRKTIDTFLGDAKLPEPVDDAFVKTLNDVFGRFEVRRMSPSATWDALFPDNASSTVDEMQERFADYLDSIIGGVAPDKIRIVPIDDTEELA